MQKMKSGFAICFLWMLSNNSWRVVSLKQLMHCLTVKFIIDFMENPQNLYKQVFILGEDQAGFGMFFVCLFFVKNKPHQCDYNTSLSASCNSYQRSNTWQQGGQEGLTGPLV